MRNRALRRVSLVGLALIAIAALAGFRQAERRERPQRFDKQVRVDFFAGFSGDRAALDRAMKICDETLRENPKYAEALVWRGSGKLYLAGQAFQSGDQQKGMELWQAGLKEMADAVALEPENVGVLIPRGAVLLIMTRFAPPEVGKPLLQTGLEDYEKVYEIQKPYFDSLSGHARGELLFGLAEGFVRAGNPDKARQYFDALVKVGESSSYLEDAKTWLDTGSLPKKAVTCRGCHAG